MTTMTVPMDSMYSVTDLARGGISRAIAQVADGHPVTIMRNNKPAGVIVSPEDYMGMGAVIDELREMRNEEARRQVRDHEYDRGFDNVDELMDYLNEL